MIEEHIISILLASRGFLPGLTEFSSNQVTIKSNFSSTTVSKVSISLTIDLLTLSSKYIPRVE